MEWTNRYSLLDTFLLSVSFGIPQFFVLFLKENSYLMFSTLLTFFGLSSNASPCTLKSPLFGVFLEWKLTFLLKSPLFEVFELNLIQNPKFLIEPSGCIHSDTVSWSCCICSLFCCCWNKKLTFGFDIRIRFRNLNCIPCNTAL